MNTPLLDSLHSRKHFCQVFITNQFSSCLQVIAVGKMNHLVKSLLTSPDCSIHKVKKQIACEVFPLILGNCSGFVYSKG